MKNIFIYQEKGEGPVNEDVCGCAGQFAWVIDGATDVFKRNCLFEKDEVCKYVNCLNSTIEDLACNYQANQLEILVKDAVSYVFRKLEIDKKAKNTPEYMLPTYAMAMVAAEGEKLYYFILGDCFISFQYDNKIELLIDKRITEFSKRNRKLIKEYYEKNKRMPESLTIYQDTRSKANAPDGYPIGSVRGSGIPQALSGTIQMRMGQRFIVCSDGFLDYFRLNGENNKNFFHLRSLHKEIFSMKAFLSDEEQYKAEMRPKKIDDCTFMLMEV